jgi:putative ABC transport system permease protein
MQSQEKKKTPAAANWLASKFIKAHLLEEFFGDLKEIYEDRISTKGRFYATLMYWVDVLHLLIGFASFDLFKIQNNPTIMHKHYLIIAIRNLARTKIYSFINILSLAVGMGVCLVICQYIYFELSYDRFHINNKNIYRVITEESSGELNKTYPKTDYALGVSAVNEIPEITQYVRKERFNRGAIVTNPVNRNIFHEEVNDLLFVDKSFFQVFNFPLKQGNRETLFKDKYSIVITQNTARKYFGLDNPIGKTLIINGPPSPGNYTVTGVLEDLPLNSHMQFDFLMPMENYLEYGWDGAVKKQDGWNGFEVVTYLTLDESADPNLVCKKLNRLIDQHKQEGSTSQEKVILQPVADIYMKSDIYSDPGYLNSTGNMQNIRIFSLISFFILFIAWVNYINLSTAKSMQRQKEVGVRKAIGALKMQLVSQFLFESVLFNIIAAILSIGIAYIALPVLNGIIGKEFGLSMLQDPMFWIWFSAIILLGSLLSGLYPAFVLSSFKPISMLGSNKSSGIGSVNLRRGLIVFQFLTSLLLIAGTYLVYKQTTFMKNQELNIDIEKIMVLRTQQINLDDMEATANFQSFRNEIINHHSISAITSSRVTPGQFGVNSYRTSEQPGNSAPYTRSISASLYFPETYGLKFIAGNTFTEDGQEGKAIINEASLRAFGFASPQNAIQQKLLIGDKQVTIVGVVENFDWHSLKELHTPYVIELSDLRSHPYISVRMNMANIPEQIAHIEATFHSFFPDQPFDYYFADDAFNRQYQSEVQFGKIFFSFTTLAVFIACIGLFALAAYSATLRVKEFGIRKVLGASTGNLVMLLSRELLVLISIAIILSIPVIFYCAKMWLENYALRIDIGIDLFTIPALVLVFVSFLTVSHRTYVTARTNPVESLRTQ